MFSSKHAAWLNQVSSVASLGAQAACYRRCTLMLDSIPTIKQCRFCWWICEECALGHDHDDGFEFPCAYFESGGVLPEVYVEMEIA